MLSTVEPVCLSRVASTFCEERNDLKRHGNSPKLQKQLLFQAVSVLFSGRFAFLTVVDTGCLRWQLTPAEPSRRTPLAGAPPSRLTGALGVFGSLAPLLDVALDVR